MQEFLATSNIEPAETENAGSRTYTKDNLRELLAGIDEIYAARGKKTQYLDLRAGFPTLEKMKGFVLGPTGNFRAPAIRKGRTLVVGFNVELLQKVLKE